MSNEEEKRCPLCAEDMDWTDQQLKPCKCGYEVCVWCWHHIMGMAEKDATEGRCPACRTPYDKDRIVGLEANFQRVAANCSSRKQKQPKAKQKPNEVKKDLSNARVIQRKMAYIIGLPLSLADEDLLQQKDYFGQYGKVTKVSLSRTAGGTVQQFVNDTCSVYITYSKEEEAVQCIQAVHGYMLDGRYLRASFGTAKYCHAWLRNMPCNNIACLYLHSIGAEEDSFGKDEIAAVHTRNRVQEIVGATEYLHKRAGSMLPPPVNERLNNYSASAEDPYLSSGLKDVAYAAVASGDHLSCSKDKDGIVRPSKHMTSFVDIVGRSSNSGSDKDVNSVAEGRMLNLCSDMSSIYIDRSNHQDKAESSDLVSSKSSSSGQLYSEPFREASKLHSVERADLTLKDTNITKERSGLTLDSEREVRLNPCNTIREDSQTCGDQRWIDSVAVSQKASLNPSYPAEVIKNYSDHAWWDMESCSQNAYDGADCNNNVNNDADEAFKQSICTNSVVNDGYNEKRFQSMAKSDRIYRCSKSFSNEEIVEHLRRLDDDSLVNDDENSAAVESSIISNILSMDFDGCDDSVLPRTVAGLLEGKDRRHGSSWNFQNSDQSRFSFANDQGYTNQELEKFSAIQDSGENQDSIYYPQYQTSRAHNVIPPGFSKPPPGFPMCMRSEKAASTSSGNYVKNSLPTNHYRTPSIGNVSSNGSDDLMDPAIMVVERGKSSSFSSSFDEETKLWHLMQQRQQSASATPTQHHHHEHPHQTSSFMQQQQSASATQHHHHHEHHHHQSSSLMQQQQSASATQYHHHHHHQGSSLMQQQLKPQWDDYYGDLSSRQVDQHQQQHQYLQPKFSNGHILNGYHQQGEQVESRSEEQRNERLGLDKLLPGYGDYLFQRPTSGDVYKNTRVFGM